jgi:hypothetical protein
MLGSIRSVSVPAASMEGTELLVWFTSYELLAVGTLFRPWPLDIAAHPMVHLKEKKEQKKRPLQSTSQKS